MAIAKRPGRAPSELGQKADDEAADAFIAKAGEVAAPEKGRDRKTPVIIRLDGTLLDRVDKAARRRGISRSAWIAFTLSNALDPD